MYYLFIYRLQVAYLLLFDPNRFRAVNQNLKIVINFQPFKEKWKLYKIKE